MNIELKERSLITADLTPVAEMPTAQREPDRDLDARTILTRPPM
jgi:hypothetical protein